MFLQIFQQPYCFKQNNKSLDLPSPIICFNFGEAISSSAFTARIISGWNISIADIAPVCLSVSTGVFDAMSAHIFSSQGLRFGSPFSPPLADLDYILKFARNATWWFIEVAPLR